MSSKRSLKAGSMLSLRNRVFCPAFVIPMWACCTKQWVLPTFYRKQTEAQAACDKLLEENITAVPKRVNITVTFPSASLANPPGDIS